ncbi:replication restart DNA helicase PriA [Ruminococcus sp. YE71]|uniref:zinc ribbon domain-containing protein n=1 Tax=unclassified Ruminococcus TaxID=2608920 RepID=UPI000889FC41|nr:MULTISPECIES: zinc ribbon domain-containing protein [unclassified Ruminococcus]SDA19036.1 replication restart DNA helicase PriA [Ruminococcus sp. YE78]SFW28814.1 replication restart DNA helicase PriA [Ruminococcus sp. YE71]
MSIMDKITSGANSISNSVRKTGETAKINNEITQNKREADKLYMKLGMLLKEAKNGSFGIDEADEISAKIDALFERNADLEKELVAIRGNRFCVNCNAEISADSLFCPECGTRNEIPKPTEPKVVRVNVVKSAEETAAAEEVKPVEETAQQEEQAQPAPEPTEKVCPSCGSKEAPEAVFCSECGTRLSD